MDNEKIGKFIAKLRKAKNLTQQQLGDLVGVGGKSVSKWERGINMPDVSIINELSKILGITSDELLKGEFDRKSTNEEHRKIVHRKIHILLLSLLIIITVISTILLMYHFKNNTHKYWISSNNEEFEVTGYIEYDKNGFIVYINKIYCDIEKCKTDYIDDIQYLITINNVVLYMNNGNDMVNNKTTIAEYLHDKVININDKYKNSVISYNDIMNKNSIKIIIEGYYTNADEFRYELNLKIADKKQ